MRAGCARDARGGRGIQGVPTPVSVETVRVSPPVPQVSATSPFLCLGPVPEWRDGWAIPYSVGPLGICSWALSVILLSERRGPYVKVAVDVAVAVAAEVMCRCGLCWVRD
mgnify:CR=1 FL=1